MIEDLIDELVRDEGTVRNDRQRHIVYKCPAGLYTIGYGIEIEQHGLSEKEARLLLQQRVQDVIDEVNNNYPFMRTQPVPIQRAIYNMAYNLGITRLSKFKKMIAAIESGNYDQAGEEAKDSQWYNQVGNRAERIIMLLKEAGQKFYD
tara:strand:- start:411 stop:854 length:444 start_codon:yes stop_codon:yes gene_type:complete